MAGNAEWVLWEESGFLIEYADWDIWARNRSTGKVRRVARWEPGSNGDPVPGWASDVSLAGDVAAWSAPVEADGRLQSRIYVANLRTRDVVRLTPNAKWPTVVSETQVAGAIAVDLTPEGKALAVPGTISLDGTVTTEDWMEPARLLAFAQGPAGTVVTRLVKEATGDSYVTVADVVTRDATGTVRTFALPNDWGPVGVGDGFIAWSDQFHLWVLPTGAAEPQLLAEVPDDTWGIRFIASGAYLYWQVSTLESKEEWLAQATCP